jgi:ABC transporter substrate binding protein
LVVPLAVRAQQPDRVRRIGILIAVAESDPVAQRNAAIFRQSLQELGWTEGRNLNIERRWAAGDIVRSRDYAVELVGLGPDLIVAVGTPSVAALKQATHSVPIVFAIVNDPVAQGFIASMAHPGGNITGFSFLEYSMVGKSLEMLKQMMPSRHRPCGAGIGCCLQSLQGTGSGLAGPHPHHRLQSEHEDLAVSYVAGASAVPDGSDDLVGQVRGHRHLDLDLRDVGDLVLSTAINLPMALLAAKAAHFANR